jgi:hypothetical protein
MLTWIRRVNYTRAVVRRVVVKFSSFDYFILERGSVVESRINIWHVGGREIWVSISVVRRRGARHCGMIYVRFIVEFTGRESD